MVVSGKKKGDRMDLVWLVWFLSGIIVGIFMLILVMVLYEENYTIRIQKEQKYILDEVQKEVQMERGAGKRKNLKFVK